MKNMIQEFLKSMLTAGDSITEITLAENNTIFQLMICLSLREEEALTHKGPSVWSVGR